MYTLYSMTINSLPSRLLISFVVLKSATSWVSPAIFASALHRHHHHHHSLPHILPHIIRCSMASPASSSHKFIPRLPIPDPICSDVPGTWAYDTMSRRIDEEILERTYKDNQETFESPEFAEILARYNELRNELRNAANFPLSYLTDMSDTQPKEFLEWNEQILKPLVEHQATWLTAPWMVAEFYVYRRLMQVLGYFDESSVGYKYDPFIKAKRDGLASSVAQAEPMLQRLPQLVSNANVEAGILVAADWALWGNRMDLSLWPAAIHSDDDDDDSLSTTNVSDMLAKNENLLADDSKQLVALCSQLHAKGGGIVDIIVDNAGFELVTDLALAQYLVESGIAKVVTFQLKSHPTFVSDALEKDLLETVDYYAKLDAKKYPGSHAAGKVWKELLENGKWQCNENPFWCQPFAMWDMTEPLRSNMASQCDLAFVKGDANYRRLLGDCKWDMTADFEDVVGAYFACPICALRTLKAEIGCGMAATEIQRAKDMDDNWMVNGRFGVLQFGSGTAKN
ncbi:hypothetical protein MPSEU_000817200 [Mayamaea pseudoterrestris]|nr:hypothetical protein MPSEU_000817200 [Mayamaea pseudoterrestris]